MKYNNAKYKLLFIEYGADINNEDTIDFIMTSKTYDNDNNKILLRENIKQKCMNLKKNIIEDTKNQLYEYKMESDFKIEIIENNKGNSNNILNNDEI
ncbi:hypothetical protein BCR32DRAFT_286734 [Anaeromyces robustus]|uniref:Uncharacterized protein n=1 Tax=Anaeromyces robustus TaxID=1754192 RepID=A0A1Y1VUL8_9FUNG|nr:hypothetical protein BCR32DRAFT_286734 [Anaeromyces robustus]|eukprot:ORX64982.1 hypothetical protein BCR32DRAFT_286734 [Anaeromyces robustus]